MPALGEALAAGRMRLATAGLPAAGLEARVLLEHAAGLDSAAFLARVREPLAAAAAARYEELLAGRAQRAPLAYLTGAREFWSLRLAVDSRVLVPRPETESLVEATLARVEPAARIADIGTGSGAVAIALAVVLPRAAFWAVDCSAGALALARANAETHGLSKRIAFLEGDLADPLAPFAGTIDAIVSNPPYIPSGENGQGRVLGAADPD
ncbi:MAG TPA: peptide chain release factor N(5)-glutamine methyltransferase, partial [Candidatus Methanoperedens sp.]|nr:peptide chain release factor N(5)-glutamine methyltransferase [Candidatus Methanoperedens sp.]